jgi:transposase
MAKQGVLPAVGDMFCVAGNAPLDALTLGRNYALRVESLRELIAVYDREVGVLERDIHAHLRHHRGYEAIQAINGVGRTIAAIAVAEIGDVERFPGPDALCCWAGLTPKHRESDLKAHRREISKQGSRLLRWALVEGSARYHGGPQFSAAFRRIAERRGTNRARVAIARKILTLIYYGLRGGEIRCLARPAAVRRDAWVAEPAPSSATSPREPMRTPPSPRATTEPGRRR